MHNLTALCAMTWLFHELEGLLARVLSAKRAVFAREQHARRAARGLAEAATPPQVAARLAGDLLGLKLLSKSAGKRDEGDTERKSAGNGSAQLVIPKPQQITGDFWTSGIPRKSLQHQR